MLDYRIGLITQLNTRLLEFCERLKVDKPHLRTVMTVIDTITDAAMKEKIGVDPDRFIDAARSAAPGVPSKIALPLTIVFPIIHGQIMGERLYFDLATLARELGVTLDHIGSGPV